MTPLRGGDAIFFFGTDFLSKGIELFTKGPSHVAMVLPPEVSILPDGTEAHEVSIIESTISRKDNGIQCASLSKRIAEYDKGSSIVAAYLSDKVRAFLDWENIWRYAKSNLDRRYNILEIGAFILNTIVLPGGAKIDDPDKHSAVCSEFFCELLRAGGWPGLNPFCSPPNTLWRGRYWREAELLRGNWPGHMPDFNIL